MATLSPEPVVTAATPAAARPPRVIHVVESLDRGAVENWLVRMLRHAKASGVPLDWTFYCALGKPGAMDSEALALGARVVHSPAGIGDKLAFAWALRDEVRRGGYDVLHGHHDLVSAVYLLSTLGLPVRKRIVHVHNADEEVLTSNPLKQALYREPLRETCLMLADRIVGISDHTLDTFLAGRQRRAGRDRVHYYGTDPSPFPAKPDRAGFRRELGLPAKSRILLFAGRLVREKNPLLAVEVLAEMRRRDPTVVGVFVGAGALEDSARARASELELDEASRFLGWRNDAPAIMACCDWFILPRPEQPMEGFGLAVLEAQLAGLRLVLSRGIPDDPLLPTAKFRRLPLAAGPVAWATAALEMLAEPAPSASAARAALAKSPMDLDRALADLWALHA